MTMTAIAQMALKLAQCRIRPSSGRLPVALRGRDVVLVAHAPWAPGELPLEAGEAMKVLASEWLAFALGSQGTLLPMFCAAAPCGFVLSRSAGTVPNPYTSVHISGRARDVCGNGQASFGKSDSRRRATAHSAHRVMAVSRGVWRWWDSLILGRCM